MKIVFAALNAQYMHTNLAVRSVAAYAQAQGVSGICLWERTINHRHRQLLGELAALSAEVVVFSLYIWNVEQMTALARDLRLLSPEAVLVAAGPETSYHAKQFLDAHPCFDFAVDGEGEAATTRLLQELADLPDSASRGTLPQVYRAPLLALDMLPFPYQALSALSGRILYYESMRGCPFSCTYCLSSFGDKVRFRSLPLVFSELRLFLDARPVWVKLVDRTFNCDKARALTIWRFLRDHDNGVTCFHFELAGELLDEEALALLATVRPGQFQFEIGVQSTNSRTLEAIQRSGALSLLFQRIRALRAPGNLSVHLDLIAGLPFEGLCAFSRSFDSVYALCPDQLQLGFLKVLRGSAMEAQAASLEIVYSASAPYEVLHTPWLSFAELTRLHALAYMVELYYNSGRFTSILACALEDYESPFAFFDRLAAHFCRHGHEERPLSKTGHYEMLGAFLLEEGHPLTDRHKWLCKYDLCRHEKPKRLPDWVDVDWTAARRQEILALLSREDIVRRALPGLVGEDPKRMIKLAHVELFPFHPLTGETEPVALVFDYSRRDVRGHAEECILPL